MAEEAFNAPESVRDVLDCPTLIDSGLDVRIDRIFRQAMIELQAITVACPELTAPTEERRAVQWWAYHYDVMLFGACDSARVLATHNLARQAWLHQRQGFEYLIRAVYLADNPKSALLELRAEPIRRFALLKQSGIFSGARYDTLAAEARAASTRHPDLADFRLPKFEQMVPNGQKERARMYALHYRLASNDTHGTVLSMPKSLVPEADGSVTVTFDARTSRSDLDELFGTLSNYLLSYNLFLGKVFDRPASANIDALIAENHAIGDSFRTKTFS